MNENNSFEAKLKTLHQKLKDVYRSEEWMKFAGVHSYMDFDLLNIMNDIGCLVEKVKEVEE